MTDAIGIFLALHANIAGNRRSARTGENGSGAMRQLLADFWQQQARALAEGYFEKARAASGKAALRYWGDAHTGHADCLGLLNWLYPQARFLYIVRDPRDTARSIAAMNGTSFKQALQTWQHFANAYEAFLAGLAPERSWTVRFEDLAADPGGSARRMLAWLGLPDDPAVHAFLEQNRNFDMHRLQSPERVEADFRATPVERWRRELDAADRDLAREVAGEFMQRHGYAA
jgi:hypothetical protein